MAIQVLTPLQGNLAWKQAATFQVALMPSQGWELMGKREILIPHLKVRGKTRNSISQRGSLGHLQSV